MKTQFRPIFLALTFTTAVWAAPRAVPPAEVPDTLDLNTAINFALQNNFAIRQARERIKEQEGVLVEARAAAIPNVAANGSYQRNDTAIGTGTPPSDRTWAINLTASQVLFSGGGLHAAIKGARLTREAAMLDLQGAINDALLDVRTRFYGVLLAREKIKVQEQNVDLLRQQLKNASDRFEAGTVSSFERLRAEVALANGQVPLITARNDFRIAVEQLRQALGFTNSSSTSLSKIPNFVGTLDFAPSTFDLQSAISSAHANRPELQRLSKLEGANEQAVTLYRSNYYPNLSLFGGYEVRKGPTNMFSDSKDGWLVGVQSQWNIFDGAATRGRVAQARSRLEQVRLSSAELLLSVDVEVRQAYSSWQEAGELADATQKTVAQAEESVRLANARYDAGTATQLDVLQAQVDLTTARTNLIQAYYTYNVAVASLRKAMGKSDTFVQGS